MKILIYLILIFLLWLSLIFGLDPGLANASVPDLQDTSISNYTQRSWQDEYLYLSSSGFNYDHIVFKTELQFDEEKSYFLNVYSRSPAVYSTVQIAYILENFDIANLPPEVTTTEAYFTTKLIKTGWNKIELKPVNNQQIKGFKLSLATPGSIVFYGNASEVAGICTHVFSPFISVSTKTTSGESDQKGSETTINKETLNIKYKVFQESKETNTVSQSPDNGQILGASTLASEPITPPKTFKLAAPTRCILHDYIGFPDKKTYYKCEFEPTKIKEVTNRKHASNSYEINITSSTTPKMIFTIYKHSCKRQTLLDPKTFFSCIDVQGKPTTKTFIPMVESIPVIANQLSKSTFTTQKNFQINTMKTNTDYAKKKLFLKSRLIASIKYNAKRPPIVINHYPIISSSTTIPAAIEDQSKPLAFFFKDDSVITQFFGKNKKGILHSGIDFALTKKPVYSPAGGEVVSYAWDDYYSKCLSGGNILKLKHSSKLFTVYMHLKSKDTAKNKLEPNERIATTGNTGSFNCKNLGYHLHFEVRLSAKQKDAVNPLDYIDLDWSKIKILTNENLPGNIPPTIKLIK